MKQRPPHCAPFCNVLRRRRQRNDATAAIGDPRLSIALVETVVRWRARIPIPQSVTNQKGTPPMTLMTWTPKLSVGVGVLDEDHKRLVAMINELYDSMQAGHGK